MQKAMNRILSASAMAILLFSALGCARWGGLSVWPRPKEVVTAETLAESLDDRAASVKSLWLRAKVIASKPGLPGKRHFEATILFESPDRLRLRAYRNNSAFLIFDLMADGWGLRLWNAADKSLYASSYERLRYVESEWAALDPVLFRNGVLVEKMLLETLASADDVRVRRRWKSYELRLEQPDAEIRARFDRASGRLVRLDYRPENDALRARLTYGDMIEVEGVRLPQWVEIEHKKTRTRLRLEVSEYKVNRKFSAEVFRPKWAIGAQSWFPLEALK